MARKATGTTFQSRDHHFAQVSFGGRQRKAVLLPHARDKDEAKARASFIAGIVSEIRRAGKAGIVNLEKIVKEAAEATDAQLPDLQKLVEGICDGKEAPTGKHAGQGGSTFKAIGEAWTSGELAKLY